MVMFNFLKWVNALLVKFRIAIDVWWLRKIKRHVYNVALEVYEFWMVHKLFVFNPALQLIFRENQIVFHVIKELLPVRWLNKDF